MMYPTLRHTCFLWFTAGFLWFTAGLAGAAFAQVDVPGGDHQAFTKKTEADYVHASPEAYEAWKDRKFGMRIHWGLYSVLGLDASWPVRGDQTSKEFQTLYLTLYQVFNPSKFDAQKWAADAERWGFKYFVLTAKHCEGFCMYDTKTKVQAYRRKPQGRVPGIGKVETAMIHYSVMDTPFKRDIVKETVDAFRARDMGIGLYFSNWDWHDPNFRWDKSNVHYDPKYSKETHPEDWQAFIDRQREQVREICTNYGKIDQIGLDCGWPEEAFDDLIDVVKMARKLQPDVLFRHRGIGPYGDYQTPEHWVPTSGKDPRLNKPWQAIEHLGSRWAWQPNDTYKPKEWLVSTLIDTCSKGGNFMVGVAPMADGTFCPETVERLEYAGDWLAVNGEAIYKTRPFGHTKEGDIRYTRSKDNKYVYAIATKWPGEKLALGKVRAKEGSKTHMLGVDEPIRWTQSADTLTIEIPEALREAKNRPCVQAWAFRIEGVPAEGVQ